jgi:hypothetical protein
MNITISPHGRTGNRLFQYALGLILAKDKNAFFNAEPIPYFENIKIQPFVPNDLETYRTSTHGYQFYDYNFLLNLKQNIIIDTYVQKNDILLQNQDFIKEQFKVKNTLSALPEDDELVIHIRDTDYKNIGAYLGDNFYRNFIQQTSFTKITIVTDSIQSPLIQEFAASGCKIFTKQQCENWSYPYFSENEIDDFNYMLHSKHLLTSQSTFSWWAAFLGAHKTIFMPFLKDSKGMWKLTPEKDDIDLFFEPAIKIIY